jgi:hypothetical protein
MICSVDASWQSEIVSGKIPAEPLVLRPADASFWGRFFRIASSDQGFTQIKEKTMQIRKGSRCFGERTKACLSPQ